MSDIDEDLKVQEAGTNEWKEGGKDESLTDLES